jgi:hypothetical protein
MPKRFRKLTDLEMALRQFESDMGKRPDCHDLALLFGDSPNVWGRILKGVGVPHGEYIAKIKLLKDYGIDASYQYAVAKKSRRYGEVTRKGKIAPHVKTVYNDVESFRETQLFESEQRGIYFDPDICDPVADYYNAMDNFYSEGPHPAQSYEEVQNVRRDFFNSLT